MLHSLTSQDGDGQGRDVFGVLAYALALAVHSVTLVLAVCGVWLLAGVGGGFGITAGLVLLAFAWSLRPRLVRMPEDGVVLRRDEAPELYALIDEVGRVVGTRGVDVVVVNGEINAGVSVLGLRRRMLVVGLPLWEVLAPRERIALLGHELAHFVNGDTRHGLVVTSAYRTLATWHHYFSPINDAVGWLQMLTNLAIVPFRLLTSGLLSVLDLLSVRASQRGEYLADRAAARVASTDAAVGLLDRLLVIESVEISLRREINSRRMGGPGRPKARDAGNGLWDELASSMGEIPDFEYERRRRVGERRGHSVDATHPPTHLRRRHLLETASLPASLGVDGDRGARIGVELSGARADVARVLVRDGLDGD
ncbi:M48 family metallopeptidase [Streptomyces sp. NPDC088387]|uniref:M48 family metallopeptidase n=1 Tax=Streptomyces sp. NPDC088387 TaxID=3365859 RepID=UPI00382A4A0F